MKDFEDFVWGQSSAGEMLTLARAALSRAKGLDNCPGRGRLRAAPGGFGPMHEFIVMGLGAASRRLSAA